MPLSLEQAQSDLMRFFMYEPTLEQVVAYMHMRAIEDQTAALREGTLASERVHERMMNTVSRAQGSA